MGTEVKLKPTEPFERVEMSRPHKNPGQNRPKASGEMEKETVA